MKKRFALALTMISAISMITSSVFATSITDYWEFHIPNDTVQSRVLVETKTIDTSSTLEGVAKKFNDDKAILQMLKEVRR